MSSRRGTILTEHICNPDQVRHYKPKATYTNTSNPYAWNRNALASHDVQLTKSVSYARERSFRNLYRVISYVQVIIVDKE